ncbi:MAG TPA: DUF3300 domain-containing protein [Rhodopila sp.]|nr:DUF3300 domain-containing protein [Rhodopila sp.]
MMQYAGKGVTMVVAGSFLLAAAGGLEVAGTTPAAAQDGGAGAAVAPAALGNAPAPVAAPINLGGAAAAPVITTPSAASAAGGGGAAAAPVTATAAASESLDQLVAPIALYPDSLVAQILAAATYPAEIVEADRWVQQNPNLDGPALAQAVDQLPWDASVKALVAFPAVLSNLDQNLTWTVALGEADESQPQAVFNAVQAMRQRAQQAGTLQTTPQQTVTAEGGNIVIQPASPDYVYVPEYDPWLVYGAPVAAYPYWDPFPGLYLDSPGFVFGLGVGIGVFAGFGWGWGHWGADWHHGWLLHDHQVYGAPGGRGMIRGYGGFAGDRFHGFAPGGVRPGGFRGFDHAVEGRGFVGHAGGVGEYRAGGFAGGGFHGGGGHR